MSISDFINNIIYNDIIDEFSKFTEIDLLQLRSSYTSKTKYLTKHLTL